MKLSSLLLGALMIPLSGCWLTLGLDGKVYESGGTAGGATGGGGGGQGCGDGAPPTLQLISRNVPVFAMSAQTDTYANDAEYNTTWRSPITASPTGAWVAFDLSQAPVAQRQKVVIVWYGQGGVGYDHTLVGMPGYNIPGTYFFEVSAAPGGMAPAEDTWKAVVQVENNTLQSRQHVLDLGGNNWIRMRVTVSDGTTQNEDAAAQFDVFSVTSSICDDWVFFGDENDGAALDQPILPDPNLPELVQNAFPNRFPLMQFESMPGWGIDDFNSSADGWLAAFPGHYVAIALGTKEANHTVSADTFRASLDRLADRIVAAGKVPVVATVPPPMNGMFTAAAMALNGVFDGPGGFFAAHPQAIRGPDLWTPFAGTSGFNKDDPAQQRMYRDAWLGALKTNVYSK
jgi:hypothetical protein